MAERLDVVPAKFRVLGLRRRKYACRTCQEVVVQAPTPARLIEGGLPSEALFADETSGPVLDPWGRADQYRPVLGLRSR